MPPSRGYVEAAGRHRLLIDEVSSAWLILLASRILLLQSRSTHMLTGTPLAYAGTEYIWLGDGLCGVPISLPGANGPGLKESLTGKLGWRGGDMVGSC